MRKTLDDGSFRGIGLDSLFCHAANRAAARATEIEDHINSLRPVLHSGTLAPTEELFEALRHRGERTEQHALVHVAAC